MNIVTILAMAAVAVALATAAPPRRMHLNLSALEDRVTKDMPSYPCNWKTGGEVSPTTEIKFTLVLKQQNIDRLKKIALEVSDPKSARYGQYLTRDEVVALTRPRDEHLSAVRAWLSEHDVTVTERNENLIVSCTVAEAERLLQTSFHTVSNTVTGQTRVHARGYSVPAKVHDALATVFDLHGLPLPPKANGAHPVDQNDEASIVPVTPAVIYSTYSVGNVTVNRGGKNIQAVGEYQDQFMNKGDLVTFFQKYVPNSQTGDDQVSKFVGTPYQPGSSVEADLDIQYIMGVATGVSTQFWEFPSNNFCGDLNQYTSLLVNTQDAPLANSISYGWQGDLKQLNCEDADIQTVDANWAKLAARGISIMISSGDSGSGYTDLSCENEAENINGQLYPSWPASSPWVTAVGATRFTNGAGSPEMASDQFGSGGGFSTMFNQSDAQWQQQVVAAYVAKGSSLQKFPPSGAFPATGRATPDVSGLGEGYQVIVGGRVQSVGGTSASSPMFAGLVSLINEARLANNMPAMGFLNPFLYQNPDAFFDVTQGTNAISRSGFPLQYGYQATEGWDAATGLGTPHFDKLLAAAMKSGEKAVPRN